MSAVPVEARRGHYIPLELEYQALWTSWWHLCWKRNPGPLEEQQVFLIAEPSLQPQGSTALKFTFVCLSISLPFCLSVYSRCGKHTHILVRMWQSEDYLVSWFFHCVGLTIEVRSSGVAANSSPTELSYHSRKNFSAPTTKQHLVTIFVCQNLEFYDDWCLYIIESVSTT